VTTFLFGGAVSRIESVDRYEPRDGALAYPESHLLRAETVHDGEGVVVFVRGELDLASGPALGRRLFELLSLPITWLTLDLAELEFIDSSGIATLNTARNAADEHGIVFRLASLPHQARAVLDLTDMIGLFTIVEPEAPLG